MAIPDSVHDKVIKSALANVDNAAAELRVVLPGNVVTRLDWKTLTSVPGAFVDEVLRDVYANLLFFVN